MASAETCVETIAQRNCCGCSRAVKTFNTFHMQTEATVVQHCTALVALPWLNVGEVQNCSKALLHHHPQVSEETTVNNLHNRFNCESVRSCDNSWQIITIRTLDSSYLYYNCWPRSKGWKLRAAKPGHWLLLPMVRGVKQDRRSTGLKLDDNQ